MLFLKRKAREPSSDLYRHVQCPQSLLILAPYELPQKMIDEIEEEVFRILQDSYEHNLIDEFSLEIMKKENEWFLDKLVHLMYSKVYIELEKQKLIRKQTIDSIRMIQRGQLKKAQASIDFAKKELAWCKQIINE